MLSLAPKTQQLIKRRMKQGGYKSADDAVLAALASLEQQERAGGFEPGELDALLEVADAEIEAGDVHDGEAVFRELRQLNKKRARRTR